MEFAKSRLRVAFRSLEHLISPFDWVSFSHEQKKRPTCILYQHREPMTQRRHHQSTEQKLALDDDHNVSRAQTTYTTPSMPSQNTSITRTPSTLKPVLAVRTVHATSLSRALKPARSGEKGVIFPSAPHLCVCVRPQTSDKMWMRVHPAQNSSFTNPKETCIAQNLR